MTEGDISAIIKKSTKKSCKLDPIPTQLVVDCLDQLLPVITTIVNCSLSQGVFPEAWKDALVKPLLKKPGLGTAYKNLRPVSNLQFLSKVTEKAVFDQLHCHLAENDLYPLLQSAYRKQHSTEMALLKVVNDIVYNMNHRHVTLLVLLDLSAAFDTLDHKILQQRLETSFGITDSALMWFKSYLSDRSQHVIVDGACSVSIDLSHGVPQGSCLGPLLFTIYASKLLEVIKTCLPIAHAYADDSQLHLSFQPDNELSDTEAITSMERCIKAV